MAAIPANVIFVWSGTNESIPAGWSRETDLDAKYPRGADASGNGGATGGAANHNHTVTDHTHIQSSHTHAVTSGTPSDIATYEAGVIARKTAASTHTHSNTSTAATATNQNATITLNATADNDPPYYEVIFVKSAGTNGIADDMIAYSDGTVPTGWALCDGTSSTPNLIDKFLKGAATDGNSGATGGTSNAHTHTQTATHNHTQDSHTHGTFNSASATNPGSTGGQTASGAHTHSIVSAANTATNQASSATLQNGDGQPEFYTLKPVQNQTGADSFPDSIIGMWKSTVASIPTGWTRVTDLDTKFAKGSGTVGTTGGSTAHTHTANAHTHTQDTHTHTNTSGSNSASGLLSVQEENPISYAYTHTHIFTLANTVAVNQNTTVTVANCTSEANYPPYLKVIFIKAPVTAVYGYQVIMVRGYK